MSTLASALNSLQNILTDKTQNSRDNTYLEEKSCWMSRSVGLSNGYLSSVPSSEGPQSPVILIATSLPIFFPLQVQVFLFSISPTVSCFPYFIEYVKYFLDIFVSYPKIKGRNYHFRVIAYNLCWIGGSEVWPISHSCQWSWNPLEGGPDLYSLWAAQIQAANFIDVFSCPLAPY